MQLNLSVQDVVIESVPLVIVCKGQFSVTIDVVMTSFNDPSLSGGKHVHITSMNFQPRFSRRTRSLSTYANNLSDTYESTHQVRLYDAYIHN